MRQSHDSHRYFGYSGRQDERQDVAGRMSRCIQAEVERVGLPLDVLPEAVDQELSRCVAKKALDDLAAEGIDVESKLVVDLGAGMGAVAVEAAVRGAWPIAVEPGAGLRDIAAERLRQVGRGAALAAAGEALPFRDSSIDIVISLQVLEHVAGPEAMLREVFRVLRPGGTFYLTCENYLSWREPHYRVFWLPLLPKPLGALYLKLRGRSPEFLYNSVTYTTRPGVVKALKRCGFTFLRKAHLCALVHEPARITNPLKRFLVFGGRRFLAEQALAQTLFVVQGALWTFGGIVRELLEKPFA
jgi:ubiquinone/menaquinone biosynthesis C-methylase UbiE